MSAINPASFVTPTSSLNVPPPFAAIGVQGGRSSPATRRRQQGHNNFAQNSLGGYSENVEQSRNLTGAAGTGLRSPYFNPYQGLNVGTSLQSQAQDMAGFPNAMYGPLGTTDRLTPYTGHHYAMLDPNAPSFSTSHRPISRPIPGERSPGQEWTGNFQSLTLGGT